MRRQERRGEPEAGAPRRSAIWGLRGFYFFNFGALGALFPFLPLLLSSRGLAPAEVTRIMAVIPLFNLVVPPLWGAAADGLKARLPALRLACLGSFGATLALAPEAGFWGSIGAVALMSFFRAPLTSLGDAAAYEVLGGRKVDFSTVRVWGSIGFALWVMLPGLVEGPRQNLTVVVSTAAIFLLAGASTLTLPAPTMRRERRVLAQVGRILRRPAVVLFLIASAVYYSGHAAYDACFSLHLRALGMSDQFIGLAWSVGVIGEIGLMLLAPRFIHRVRSSALLTGCAVAAALRWGLLSLLTQPSALLAVQLLHAVTFGLWYLSLVKFAQERAPDHLRASLQSITLAAMGLGMVLGYLLGGEVLERSGGERLYQMAAAAAAVAVLLYGATLFFQRREGSEPSVDDLGASHS